MAPTGIRVHDGHGPGHPTWTNAPVAAEGTWVTANGVVYTIVGTDKRVHHIWWVRNGALHFISNR